MAAKPLAKLTIILIVIIAGIAAAMGARSRFLLYRKAEENRFISTYLAMSIAREKYIGNADSLKIARKEIFDKSKTDSTWMANYGKKLSLDLVRSEQVWLTITNKLDSLRKSPEPDNISATHQHQP